MKLTRFAFAALFCACASAATQSAPLSHQNEAMTSSAPPARTAAAPATAAPAPQQAAGPSLYKRLGGYDAIAAVTDDFLGRMIGDAQLGHYFAGLGKDSKTRLREHVIGLLCETAGGPCHYVGRDVRNVHEGLGITVSDWNRAVTLLGQTLDHFKVPNRERQELVGAIALMKEDIVEKR